MPGRRHTTEQIPGKLAEAEVIIAKDRSIAEICRKLEIAEQTYCRRRKEFGGVRTDQAKRLKELEKENVRLKKLVAELSLDKQILEETSRGNF